MKKLKYHISKSIPVHTTINGIDRDVLVKGLLALRSARHDNLMRDYHELNYKLKQALKPAYIV